MGKPGKPWNSSKIFSLYWSFLQICFEVRQKPKSNLPGHGILVQGFTMPNLVNQYKTIFWGSETNLGTLQKPSPYIEAFYKFVLKSVKSLIWIFWVIEYCFQALECQIWLTNTKPFPWKIEAKLETLQKLSSNIGVLYKFAFKSVKGLNRISWVIHYWF